MTVVVTDRDSKGMTVSVYVPYGKSMLETENLILKSVNELGSLSTAEALSLFDTDGDPISVGGERMTSKGALPKEYQTPYGPVAINRHVYQCGGGGKTYCPLEDKARIIVSSTPRFARLFRQNMQSLVLVECVKISSVITADPLLAASFKISPMQLLRLRRQKKRTGLTQLQN